MNSTQRMVKALILIVFALLPLFSSAGSRVAYNCPKHGPRTEYEIQRNGQTIVCKACMQEKERSRKEEEAKAKADRISRGEIFESDLYRMDKITINTRSFGSTNNFERVCFSAITNRYFIVADKVCLRSDYANTFIISQHIGQGEYLARWGSNTFKLNTNDDGLIDESRYTLFGILTNESYEYKTVLGSSKRVRVFNSLARLGIKAEELTFADVLSRLNAGETFTISMEYESKEAPTHIAGSYRDLRIMTQNGYNPNSKKRRIEATITMKGGSIVRFGK